MRKLIETKSVIVCILKEIVLFLNQKLEHVVFLPDYIAAVTFSCLPEVFIAWSILAQFICVQWIDIFGIVTLSLDSLLGCGYWNKIKRTKISKAKKKLKNSRVSHTRPTSNGNSDIKIGIDWRLFQPQGFFCLAIKFNIHSVLMIIM